MKKLFMLAALLAVVFCGKAQNVQLHYDFGGALYDKDLHGRPVLTSTVEMFKADKWGSTYFFIDMDYTSKGLPPDIGRFPANCVSGNRHSPYMSSIMVELPTVFLTIMPIWLVLPIHGTINCLQKDLPLPLCINIYRSTDNPIISS